MSDLISEISKRLDIVEVISEYVPLTKKGKNFWGICPFHQDSNPSMSVSPDKQIYKCFACGASGGIINFVADFKKIPFNKALQELAEKIGIKVTDDSKPRYTEPQQKLVSAFNEATTYLQYMLDSEEGSKAKEYALARQLTPRILERFRIGYAPEAGLKDFLLKKGHDEAVLINASLINSGGKDFFHNRLMFPIANEFGDVVGYSARTLTNEDAKYINSSESLVFHKSAILYNFVNAQDMATREKKIYICEGQMDVIALDKAGFSNAVAVMGTALTREHLKNLKGWDVILNFDSDKAGENATMKSVQLLIDNRFKVEVVLNDEGKDPDEIFAKQGAEKLGEVLQKVAPGLEWVYQKHLTKYDRNSVDKVEDMLRSFGKYLASATPVERDFYVAKIVKELSLSSDTVLELIGPARRASYQPAGQSENSLEPASETVKRPKINYSYAAIRSMLKKQFLIDVYINKMGEINFLDRQLVEIAKYLVNHRKGLTKEAPSEGVKNMVKTILNEGDLVASDAAEFEIMLNRAYGEFLDFYIHEYRVKLDNETDEQKKDEYLQRYLHLRSLRRKIK